MAKNCIWLQIPFNHRTLATHSITIYSAVSFMSQFSLAQKPAARDDSTGQQLKTLTLP